MKSSNEKYDVLYQLDGRPSLGLSLSVGLQHVFAMFAGNLAPILILAGVVSDVSSSDSVLMIQCAMFIAGVVTLLQLYPIKIGKFQIGCGLPVVMGTSFAFVPSMKVVGAAYGISGVLGAALLGGFAELLFGIFIKPLKKYFPPLVVGCVVVTIGISLLKIGANYFAGGVGSKDFGSPENILLGFTVFMIITLLSRFATGVLKAMAILVGLIIGYVIAIFLGKVDFSPILAAAWFELPRPMHFSMTFHLDAILTFSAVYIIVALETMGNTAGITMATMGRDSTPEETSGTIIADSLAAQLAAIFNTLPVAAFGQNAAIVCMTRIINRFAVATGAVIMIVCAFVPKIGAVFSTLPPSVLGGAVTTVFAMILLNGIKMIAKAGFSDENCRVVAAAFGLGYGLGIVPAATEQLPAFIKFFVHEPIMAVCTLSVFANILFVRPQKEEQNEELREESTVDNNEA